MFFPFASGEHASSIATVAASLETNEISSASDACPFGTTISTRFLPSLILNTQERASGRTAPIAVDVCVPCVWSAAVVLTASLPNARSSAFVLISSSVHLIVPLKSLKTLRTVDALQSLMVSVDTSTVRTTPSSEINPESSNLASGVSVAAFGSGVPKGASRIAPVVFWSGEPTSTLPALIAIFNPFFLLFVLNIYDKIECYLPYKKPAFFLSIREDGRHSVRVDMVVIGCFGFKPNSQHMSQLLALVFAARPNRNAILWPVVRVIHLAARSVYQREHVGCILRRVCCRGNVQRFVYIFNYVLHR
nr:MAG TPA: hypothetical protein [Caudoviricetes sp.]